MGGKQRHDHHLAGILQARAYGVSRNRIVFEDRKVTVCERNNEAHPHATTNPQWRCATSRYLHFPEYVTVNNVLYISAKNEKATIGTPTYHMQYKPRTRSWGKIVKFVIWQLFRTRAIWTKVNEKDLQFFILKQRCRLQFKDIIQIHLFYHEETLKIIHLEALVSIVDAELGKDNNGFKNNTMDTNVVPEDLL